MNEQALRVHAFVPYSRANGPGLRAVLWVQGCSLGCPGCYNPQTHSWTAGQLVPVRELAGRIAALSGTIEGITVSGGEPLQQRPALLELLRCVRKETTLSSIVFTGFAWEEVQRMPEAAALCSRVDVLIAGRYDAAQRLASSLRGSANKTMHFLTNRYGPADLNDVPCAEVILTPRGELLLSGIDPLHW